MGSELKGMTLSMKIKPEVNTAHFDFERVVVAAEDGSLLFGAGPIIKRDPKAAAATPPSPSDSSPCAIKRR
jgi:hypothetical protein